MVLLDGNLQLDVIGTGVNICGKFHWAPKLVEKGGKIFDENSS